MRIAVTLSLLLGLTFASAARGQEAPTAFTGARLIPISGPEIDDGVLVIHNGTITAVGGADTPIPLDATRVELNGRVIMPGLVDTHSHVGEPWGGDESGPREIGRAHV